MAEQVLQMTEIESYCRVFDFEEDKEFFFSLMFRLDSEYMKHLSGKRERESAASSSKGERFRKR